MLVHKNTTPLAEVGRRERDEAAVSALAKAVHLHTAHHLQTHINSDNLISWFKVEWSPILDP
jgi:hypothetical protein